MRKEGVAKGLGEEKEGEKLSPIGSVYFHTFRKVILGQWGEGEPGEKEVCHST